MQDEKIVALYWERNEKAIEETSQKYGTYLSRISYNILADMEDGEECVNDTYLAAWNSMPPHRPEVLSTYLGKIIRQKSIDVFRKRKSVKRYASEYAISLEELGDSFSDKNTPEEMLDSKLLDDAINRKDTKTKMELGDTSSVYLFSYRRSLFTSVWCLGEFVF